MEITSSPTKHTSPTLTAAWMKQVGRSPEPLTLPKTSQQMAATSDILDQLVYSFLVHHGYSRTAQVLLQNLKDTKDLNVVPEAPVEDVKDVAFDSKTDLVHRQGRYRTFACAPTNLYSLTLSCRFLSFLADIRTAIVAGDIDCAIKLTQAFFPQVLNNDDVLLFRLKKRKFIELLRLANDSANHSFCETGYIHNMQPLSTTFEENNSTHPHDVGADKAPTVFGTPRKLAMPAPITTAPASDIPQTGRRVSYASITATPSSISPPHSSHGYFGGRSLDDGNSVDEPSSPTNFFHSRRRRRSSSHMSYTSLSSFEEDDEDLKHDMREAIRFGHLLQEQYGKDQRPTIKSGMAEIHLLLSEAETYHVLCAAVKALDIAGRDALASELNTAILGKRLLFVFCNYHI